MQSTGKCVLITPLPVKFLPFMLVPIYSNERGKVMLTACKTSGIFTSKVATRPPSAMFASQNLYPVSQMTNPPCWLDLESPPAVEDPVCCLLPTGECISSQTAGTMDIF